MQTAQHLCHSVPKRSNWNWNCTENRTEHTTNCIVKSLVASRGPRVRPTSFQLYRFVCFYSLYRFSLSLLAFLTNFLMFCCCCCCCEISMLKNVHFLFRCVSVWGFSCFLWNTSHISVRFSCIYRSFAFFCVKQSNERDQKIEWNVWIALSILIVVLLLKRDNDDNNGLTWHSTNRSTILTFYLNRIRRWALLSWSNAGVSLYNHNMIVGLMNRKSYHLEFRCDQKAVHRTRE